MTPEFTIILTTLGLYAVAVVSPGPNFALISRLALAGSRTAAWGATIGLALSATFYAILTIAGLSVLLARVGWLASLVQIAGGSYLVYLGVRTLLEAKVRPAGEPAAPVRETALHGLRMGIIVNLTNPKVITFFLSLYAATMPAEASLWTKLAVVVGGFLLEIMWYGLVILLFSTPPARAAYDRVGHWIERAMGTALTAFGLILISEVLSSRGAP